MFGPSKRSSSRVPEHASKPTPFPWKPIVILSLARITEPIAFCSIFPYVYYMIKSFGVTRDHDSISMYCGLLTSTFAFCQFATGMLWGSLSDKIGRKPVVLIALLGSACSMLILGFAKSLPVAVLARVVGGCLNGNIGVMQTMVAEIVTVPEQQPLAFSILPFVFCVGSIFGSALGGLLADPVRNYGWSHGTIWDSFPYLLPNFVVASILFIGLFFSVFFLEETNERVKDRRDIGIEMGNWITRVLSTVFRKTRVGRDEDSPETRPLLQDSSQQYHSIPEIASHCEVEESQSTGNTKRDVASSTSLLQNSELQNETIPDVVVPGVQSGENIGNDIPRSTFNRQVVVQIAAFGLIAFHTISFETLLPVLLSMKENHEPPRGPITFIGGYELSTSVIGAILGAQGIYQMIFQLFFFAPLIHRFGALRTLQFCSFTFFLIYIFVPYTVLLPAGALRMTGLAVVVALKITWTAMVYPANMLLLTNAAPSLLVLGTINGVAAAAASLCRAGGPLLAGVIQTYGLHIDMVGLPWWMMAAVAVGSGFESMLMEDTSKSKSKEPRLDEAMLPDENFN